MSKNYSHLSDSQKVKLIQDMYVKENKSFQKISEELGTYPNRLLRDAKKFNIPIRSRSEAQKNALKSGESKIPTQGRKRSEEEKRSIGLGVLKNWQNADDKKIQEKSKRSKRLWEKRTAKSKSDMVSKANDAVRQTSKVGSKMEHFILNFLLDKGYKVEFHKEQTLVNTKLQMDLFLPKINLAIEVDGPSHFKPVWGQDVLNRNIAYDEKKSGLIIGKGYKLIRVKQLKDFSKSRARIVCNKIHTAIKTIDQQSSKIIEIEDK